MTEKQTIEFLSNVKDHQKTFDGLREQETVLRKRMADLAENLRTVSSFNEVFEGKLIHVSSGTYSSEFFGINYDGNRKFDVFENCHKKGCWRIHFKKSLENKTLELFYPADCSKKKILLMGKKWLALAELPEDCKPERWI